MKRPAPGELPPDLAALLSRTERLGIHLGDLFARRLPFVHVWMRDLTMGPLIWWLCMRGRLRLSGIEHVRALPPDSSLLFVANHRSFFDFFTVIVALRVHAGFRHRMYFPVRAEFFYETPLGVAINAVTAGMSMFPPMFRTGPRRPVNTWSVQRCAEELRRPRTALGVHPEGTRGKGPDPFTLMPARSGPGRIALAAPEARVMPVFVLGLSNDVPREVRRNLLSPGEHPMWIAFGPEVDLEDLRAGETAHAAMAASERMRAAILDLAHQVRRAREAEPKRC